MSSKQIMTTVEVNLDDFDDEELREELESRGFYVSKIKTSDYWFGASASQWRELATYTALGEMHEALALIEYISNGAVNAVCIANYANTMKKIATARTDN